MRFVRRLPDQLGLPVDSAMSILIKLEKYPRISRLLSHHLASDAEKLIERFHVRLFSEHACSRFVMSERNRNIPSCRKACCNHHTPLRNVDILCYP